jgi:PAS domain S-box-containing protein
MQQAKDVLRRSEGKFRRILASTPDVAWTSDRHGRTIYISPKAEVVLGYTTQEIYAGGTHLWLGQIHAEDFGRVNQTFTDLFRSAQFRDSFVSPSRAAGRRPCVAFACR